MRLNPDMNILQHVQKDDLKPLRKSIINLVLGTDMSNHYDEMGLFKVHFIDNPQPTCNEDTSKILFSILLHTADVSNPTRPKEVAIHWAEAFAEEQFLLGDKRKALGLPLGPFMDRKSPNVPKTQTGFIQFIVKPLFELVNSVVDLHEALTNIDNNFKYWSGLDGTKYKMQYMRESRINNLVIEEAEEEEFNTPQGSDVNAKRINVEEVYFIYIHYL